MNERSLAILKLLIRDPNLKLTDLEKILQLTKRQINYAFKQVNETLKERNLPTINRSYSGSFEVPLILTHAFGTSIDNSIDQSTEIVQTDFYSENERVYMLIMYLLISHEVISLAHFMDLLDVSKNTVLEDLKNSQSELEKYNLQLEYSRQDGYSICGEELQIRLLMNEMIRRKELFSDFNNPLSDSMAVKQDRVIHFIRSIEKELGVSYADEAFDSMTEVICYTVSRIINKQISPDFFRHQVRETREFIAVTKFLPEDWIKSEDDKEWLTLTILSSNMYQNNSEQYSQSDQLLKEHVRRIINQFQRQTLIEIDDRLKFEKRLLAHLRPAWFRIKYGLKLGNFGLEDLVKDNNHAILMELLRELIVPIEKEIGKEFPNDELELLSFYFGHQLSKSEEINVPKKKAVVVCTNGMIVSKMMRENLKKLFPELHFLATFSVREFQNFQTDYELVFTTVPLKTELPQYIVDPIMNYKEQISLRYRVLKDTGLTEVDDIIDELTKIVANNSVIKNAQKLKNELREYFLKTKEEPAITDFKILPELIDYISIKSIQIVRKKIDWMNAILIATKPLVTQNVISEDYVIELIRQTASETNSSFLGEQMAIPHSITEDGVLADGIAFLISKEPIIFPNGRTIHFIAPIAILDYSNHLRAINQLADLALNKKQNELLLATEEEGLVYQLISNLE